MRPRVVTLIDGVLDVLQTDESARAAGRGERTFGDPRLSLMNPAERLAMIELWINDGVDTSDLRWLVSVDTEAAT